MDTITWTQSRLFFPRKRWWQFFRKKEIVFISEEVDFLELTKYISEIFSLVENSDKKYPKIIFFSTKFESVFNMSEKDFLPVLATQSGYKYPNSGIDYTSFLKDAESIRLATSMLVSRHVTVRGCFWIIFPSESESATTFLLSYC